MKKLGLYCAFALVLASCDSAPIPENNAEDLQHDEATRVELILHPAHWHKTTSKTIFMPKDLHLMPPGRHLS